MRGIKNTEQVYITDEQRRKCRRVMNAFAELYRKEDIIVRDAGKYGFVKLQYYKPAYGFDVVMAFTESNKMFEDLWQEWRNSQLLALSEGTPFEDISYKKIYQCLPKNKQREIMNKRRYFEIKAGQTERLKIRKRRKDRRFEVSGSGVCNK